MAIAKKYACPECKGSKILECCECGNEKDCDACDGSGLNTDLIDVKAFNAACGNLNKAWYDWQNAKPKQRKGKQPKYRSTWDLVEGRETIGRTDGETKIPYSAFLKSKINQPSPDPLAWLDAQPEQETVGACTAWLDK